ncbi:NUDIX domain-containing protein [Paraburkholderia sp. EG287A]|uniref:NUDIX domain-containing protein n=1 Tax=Paraburkholderia sp. EG287A TaxID=3237012 RepID=UPI0034D2EB0A
MHNDKVIYATALMFNRAFTRAAFVVKNRPVFLAGRICPTGGKVEPGETPRQAAAREHGEETLVVTKEEAWVPYGRIERPGATVHCFYTVSDEVESCRTNHAEENCEEVVVLDVKDVLVAAVTQPGRVVRPGRLQDSTSVADDLAALIGLVFANRKHGDVAVLTGN